MKLYAVCSLVSSVQLCYRDLAEIAWEMGDPGCPQAPYCVGSFDIRKKNVRVASVYLKDLWAEPGVPTKHHQGPGLLDEFIAPWINTAKPWNLI